MLLLRAAALRATQVRKGQSLCPWEGHPRLNISGDPAAARTHRREPRLLQTTHRVPTGAAEPGPSHIRCLSANTKWLRWHTARAPTPVIPDQPTPSSSDPFDSNTHLAWPRP